MALSEIESQLLLVRLVGDVDQTTGDPVLPTSQGSTGIFAANITRLWVEYAGKALASPRLRDLYVQRAGVDLVLGVLERKVDFSTGSDGFSVRLSQRIAARQQQRAAIQKEIERVERQMVATGAPAIGQLTTIVPIEPPVPGELSNPFVNGPYASDPRYTGSPYWPKRRRIVG